MERRFKDLATDLDSFAGHFAVVCPRCGGRGDVRPEGPRFACGGCGHGLIGQGQGWQGPARISISKKCGRCGAEFERTLQERAPHPQTVDVVCPECGAEQRIAHLAWQPVTESGRRDPYFGFRLWYQTACGDHVLWAYNEQHLAFLRDFVAAKQRERTPNVNRSLVSRLPRWIASAKNRDAVLKAIDRLLGKTSA